MSDETKRLQIEISDKGLKELQELMRQLDKNTYAETLRASLKITKFFEDAKENNDIILKDKKTGAERQIEFRP
jgi:hypothetical protein